MAEAECVPHINHFVLTRASGESLASERDWTLRRCRSLESLQPTSTTAVLPAVKNYLRLRARVAAELTQASKEFDLHFEGELSADLRDLHPDDVLDAHVDKLGAQIESSNLPKRRQLDNLVGLLNFKDFYDSKRLLNRIVSQLRACIRKKSDRSCLAFEQAEFLPSEVSDLVFLSWIADVGKKLPCSAPLGTDPREQIASSSTAAFDTDTRSFETIVAAAEQELRKTRDSLQQTIKSLFKNYLVLKKCDDMKRKILGQARCKICAEAFDIDHFADHSFQCFETKILREELDKINRMIIKLKNNSRKAKTSIRRLHSPSHARQVSPSWKQKRAQACQNRVG
jgi:hypothetical protein